MLKLLVVELIHQATELGQRALYARLDAWKRANESAAETAARHAREDFLFLVARGRDPGNE